jgi:putative membrane protein
MRLCLVSTLLVTAFAMSSTVAAQPTQPHGTGQGNPAGTPPGTREAAPGVPAPRQLNEADRKFLKAATMGGAAEVEFAQLAERMSRNSDIKRFAQRMVREHQEANKRIATIARNAGLPPMQGLDPDHKAIFDRLSTLQGAAFDRAYIDSQIVDHQVMAQLLEYEIGSGQDPELKGLAAELLPAILEHLQTADAVLSTLGQTVAKQP